MLQQSRTIKGILVLWGLSLAMVIAGCGEGEDTSPPINQKIPQNVASPKNLSEKGFRFSTGEPFHIDPQVPMQGDVLLFFGDFQGTNSAPFTLVSGGFRATGTATWLNIYTLSVQESTFPAAQPPPSTQGARGPQVGDQLFININLTTNQAQEVSVPVNPNGVRDFTRLELVGKTIDISRSCDPKTGEGDPVDLGTLEPAQSTSSEGGCITVNGSINSQERNSADTFKLTLQPLDQIVQFILTFPTPTADDSQVGFNLFIRKDKPNIMANENVLQSCRSTKPGQAVCSIVLQRMDFAAGSPLPMPIEIEVKPPSRNNSLVWTGNYSLEILSNVSPEVGNRKNICPDTGPGTIQEHEVDGSNGRYVLMGSVATTDPDRLLFQGVGRTLRSDGCLPIRGGKIGAPIKNPYADGVDNYEFSVESTVNTVAFLLYPENLRNNAFDLFIDEITPEGKLNQLVQCRTTTGLITITPSTPVTCAISVPPTGYLRVGVRVAFVCPENCTSAISDYSLDIIAVDQPSISVTPIPAPSPPTGIVVPTQ